MVGSDGTEGASAYGGDGWQPRDTSLREELGTVWGHCGATDEFSALKGVILHRPGDELAASSDPRAAQMLEPLDLSKAQAEHDAMAEAYRNAGVAVHYVDPPGTPQPNQMFCADLMWMTPEGAVLARPASSVRAGEERQVARRLADLGVPILMTPSGSATFEGADAMWLDPRTVVLGLGLRTNHAMAEQLAVLLARMNINLIPVDLPYGTMHLMGMLRIAGPDIAVAWYRRTPHRVVAELKARGYRVVFLPDEPGRTLNKAINFVTLASDKILMPAGYPQVQAFYEEHGIECICVSVDELTKAAGAIGCLTGVMWRSE
ncbi:MAG: amidinotransferase [Rhodospirillaceae bacterium]|jgi:arginine deiminase|nr:amidinotransferase [Rhodospirillaceae bacterium]